VDPSARKLTPPAYTTPICKAEPAKLWVPFNMERKFASNRLVRPNRLYNTVNKHSHVTAVFQGIAATVKAHEAYGELEKDAKGEEEFKLRKNHSSRSQIDEELHEMREISASKAFVDVVAEMQQYQGRSYNTYPLYRKLEAFGLNSVFAPREPAKYME
jgi:hypothetical protein